MAKLRDIINAATPGPWEVYRLAGRRADVMVDPNEEHRLIAGVDGAVDGACSLSDARHIAAYSPDHALLIEDALSSVEFILCNTDSGDYHCEACGADSKLEWNADGIGVDESTFVHAAGCVYAALAAYRKERGYE